MFTGPVLDALPTSKFLALWGLFVLVMAAVAYATAALQEAVLGPAGTLIVVVLFIVFGAPASGGTVPSAYLPGFWRTFGPYLPAGAGTTAVRNTLYFDANAITRVLPDPLRLSRRRSAGSDRRPAAAGERHDCRGRGLDGGRRHRRLGPTIGPEGGSHPHSATDRHEKRPCAGSFSFTHLPAGPSSLTPNPKSS